MIAECRERSRSVPSVAMGLALSAFVGVQAPAADWPQFRGALRDGVSPEGGLLAPWPAGGPQELWRRPIGEGYSAISIVGDRLYTMYAGDHAGKPVEFAAALDAKSGAELWRVPLSDRYDNEFGNGPRSTPTVDGDTVFVLDSRGIVAALATSDGTERWRASVTEMCKSKQPYFGFSTSVLVDGDLVLLEGGGPEGKSYAALDRKTGSLRWTSGDGRGEAGYNSPLLLDRGEQRSYLYLAGSQLRSVDREGRELWSFPWPAGETHAMPVLVPPDRVFASGAEGVGAHLLRVDQAGGQAKVSEVWSNPSMRNHFSSSVIHDGHLYGFDNATLKAISLADGALGWSKRGFGKGSLILADGHLFVLSEAGELVFVQATPKEYLERGRVQALRGRCWTAPSLAGGKLYLRNHSEIVGYDLRG